MVRRDEASNHSMTQIYWRDCQGECVPGENWLKLGLKASDDVNIGKLTAFLEIFEFTVMKAKICEWSLDPSVSHKLYKDEVRSVKTNLYLNFLIRICYPFWQDQCCKVPFYSNRDHGDRAVKSSHLYLCSVAAFQY